MPGKEMRLKTEETWCGRILQRDVLDHEGFDLQTEDRINALFSRGVFFLNGGFSETRNVKHSVLQETTAQRGSGSNQPLTPGPFECRRLDSISHL